MKHRTIKKETMVSGIGIHSGAGVNLIFRPAKEGDGIYFLRNGVRIPAHIDYAIEANRATILEFKNNRVTTPEHLLSACWGLGISCLEVEMDQEECPILDGSAKSYVDLLTEAGVVELNGENTPAVLSSPFEIECDDKKISCEPNDTLEISYELNYEDSFVGKQEFTFKYNSEDYISSIAPARTYGFEAEIQSLLKRGLAMGGSLENAVVIGNSKYINKLRFPDELVRHKILDIMGDFSLLGQPFYAKITAVKSGHSENLKITREISSSLKLRMNL